MIINQSFAYSFFRMHKLFYRLLIYLQGTYLNCRMITRSNVSYSFTFFCYRKKWAIANTGGESKFWHILVKLEVLKGSHKIFIVHVKMTLVVRKMSKTHVKRLPKDA